MTGLHNTDLTTSQKIEFSAKALANQGLHGSGTQLSQYGHYYQTAVIYHMNEKLDKSLYQQFESLEKIKLSAFLQLN